MSNFLSKNKFIFYLANIFLIVLYLFPGSILGFLIYDDMKIQPQITSDFLVSTNHLYAFFLISLIGILTFNNSKKLNLLILYFLLLSIILEIFHLIIPERSFQLPDLFGNLIGVFLMIIIKILKNNFLLLIILFVSACSSIPSNTKNSCSIFNERYLWYKHAKKSEKKWGTPIYLQLAIIKMESDFDWLAKPPRQKLFKVIPYKRPSSSFGYSQAVKGTWEQYKNETGNKLATRTRFKDSVDFIGWYTSKSEKILKISKEDAFRQYVAYHEGWGNYKNYKSNEKVINLAKRVEKQSNIYKNQLSDCKNSLSTRKYIIF